MSRAWTEFIAHLPRGKPAAAPGEGFRGAAETAGGRTQTYDLRVMMSNFRTFSCIKQQSTTMKLTQSPVQSSGMRQS